MIESQIRARGVSDERVLEVMERIPRHQFVLPEDQGHAYGDNPLPIGRGQTISQPYIVAVMTEKAELRPIHRVLEIGTGSGYQTAVLSELAAEVFSIEIIESLSLRARSILARLGHENVHCRVGNGSLGWPEAAPFDAILVTAAPREVPPALVDQLAEGGRLVIPVGRKEQELLVLTKRGNEVEEMPLFAVRFVPMTGI